VAWFNVDAPPEERLPDLGRPDALAFVVANSRALWPVLRRVVAGDPTLAHAEHPLDTYVTRILETAVCQADCPATILYAHTVSPRAIPIQRIAERAGLAPLGPAFLSIHPTWGPWFGFRAVVVVDAAGPPEAKPPWNPCALCPRPCVAALAEAREMSSEPAVGAQGLAAAWRAWVRARDACPVGREHRYDEDQIEYHYTKRRSLIGAAG
jgi:hypothetical protein